MRNFIQVFWTCDRKVSIFGNTTNKHLSVSDDHSFDGAGNTPGDAQERTFIYDGENKRVKVRENNRVGNTTTRVMETYKESIGRDTMVFLYDAFGGCVSYK